MENNFLDKIKNQYKLSGKPVNEYSPLVFAYIGDAVYEVFVRSILVLNENEQVEKLHKKATSLVKAEAQKNIVVKLLDIFTEEEMAVYKRARNAKQHTTPKNGNIADYHKATGFEAVIGYLYLTNQIDRIFELINMGLELPGLNNE